MVADALLFSNAAVAARCRLPVVFGQLLLAQQILAGNYLRPAGCLRSIWCIAGESELEAISVPTYFVEFDEVELQSGI